MLLHRRRAEKDARHARIWRDVEDYTAARDGHFTRRARRLVPDPPPCEMPPELHDDPEARDRWRSWYACACPTIAAESREGVTVTYARSRSTLDALGYHDYSRARVTPADPDEDPLPADLVEDAVEEVCADGHPDDAQLTVDEGWLEMRDGAGRLVRRVKVGADPARPDPTRRLRM